MADKKDQRAVLKKVLLRIRPYSFGVVAALILATVNVVMSLYIPILVGKAIDCIIEKGKVDFASMGRYLWMVGICTGVAALSKWVMGLINNRMTYHVTGISAMKHSHISSDFR